MKGLVTNENGDLIKVHIVRKEACGKCNACFTGQQKDMDIDAKNLCDAEIGDWVELELQENAFVKAVLISYAIPLIGFFIGLFFGYYVVSPIVPLPASLVGFGMGMIGVLICYAWIKSQNHRWEAGGYLPLAVRLTAEGCTE